MATVNPEDKTTPARGRDGAQPKDGVWRHRKPLKSGWLSKAWLKAQAKAQGMDGEAPADIMASVKDRTGPVERARGIAEQLAPMDMLLLAAVTHGLSPEQVEDNGKPLRLITDLAQRRLSMVGLKSGEAVEHDMSDRLRSFLELWHQDKPARPAAIDITPPALPASHGDAGAP